MNKLLLIFILVIISCSDNGLNFNLSEIEEDFSHIENPKERWEAYQLDGYHIEQRWYCYCNPPIGANLYIQNDKVTSFDFLNKSNASFSKTEKESAEYHILTVEDAFHLIEKNRDSAYSIEVEYNPKYGYPSNIDIDYAKNIADDEIGYFFTNLKKID